jgi:metal-responsive CopG/Arc/MetJ family transcriptional regulator
VKEAGFSVPSKAIQTAFHSFIDEHDWKIDVRKKGAETIVILFNNHTFYKRKMSTQLQHKYNDIISTITHLHLEDDNCFGNYNVREKKLKG